MVYRFYRVPDYMNPKTTKLSLHRPANYRICVQGTLGESWFDYFIGLTLISDSEATPAGVTILTGQMTDQAALLGILNSLYGLGLPLLSVELVADE